MKPRAVEALEHRGKCDSWKTEANRRQWRKWFDSQAGGVRHKRL